MFKLYYAAAIDTCPEKALKQIEVFKKIFSKFIQEEWTDGSNIRIVSNFVKNPLEVYGAGFGDSPIITPESSKEYKGAVSAYDLRKIRECDILLVVTDLKQFAAGTMMELEYARNLGIYTILFVLPSKKVLCMLVMVILVILVKPELKMRVTKGEQNIFLETYANKIIYSMEELEAILKDLTQ